jgi:hypothetical protein
MPVVVRIIYYPLEKEICGLFLRSWQSRSELAVSFICPSNQTHPYASVVDKVTSAIFRVGR